MKIRLLIVFCLLITSQFGTRTSFAGIFLTNEELARSTVFAEDDRFRSVGMISLQDGSEFTRGSGVLIAPNWVLTAAHVVRNTTGTISFGLGSNAAAPIGFSRVLESKIHPSYVGNSLIGDIALLRLETPMTFSLPATLYRGPAPSFPSFNPIAYTAGFGQFGIVNGELKSDLLMRAGANVVTSARSIFDTWNVDTGSANDRVDMEWKGAPGDSGGGWFIDVNGESQLGAISVSVSLPYNGAGVTSGTSVSRFAPWIDSTITAVPEPCSLALLCTTGAFLVFRRRRKQRNELAAHAG